MTETRYHFKTGGRPEKYPYDEWFDGEDHPLRQEEDFPDATPKSFRAVTYVAAARRGLRVRIGIEDDCVVIRALGRRQ